MQTTIRPGWACAAVVWVLLICLASTSAAERFFDGLYTFMLAGKDDGVSGAPLNLFWQKKAMHVFLFFVLAGLLSRSFHPGPWRTRIRIAAIGAMIGIVSEGLQLLFPGREPTVRDAIINAAVTFIGATIFCKAEYSTSQSWKSIASSLPSMRR